MFVNNFEEIFEGLGFFKHLLTSYNDEILNSFINMSLYMFFSLKLHYMMQSMVPSTHIFKAFFYLMMMSTLWRIWWIGSLVWAYA